MGKDSDSAGGSTGFERTPPCVPGFKLVRWIGGGSYGDVWLGHDVLGQWRAVKVVHHARFPDDEPYEREFRGITAYAEIAGEEGRLLRVYHAGREDAQGYFYYAMELADPAEPPFSPETYEARTLKSALGHASRRSSRREEARISENPGISERNGLEPPHVGCHHEQAKAPARHRLPFKQCLVIAREVATALDHLHQRGLVHRDVKPSNIVFIRGEAKLADIGLVAKMEMSLSQVGAAHYLPQEGAGTPQGDLYALGKVLYEMCTALPVDKFPALPILSELPTHERKGIRELNHIILKACNVGPERRYQSAEQFIHDLDYVDEGSSLRALRWMKRAAWAAAAMALLLATALALVGGWIRAREEVRNTRQLRLLEQIHRAPREAKAGGPWFAGVWSNATEAAKIRRTDEVRNEAAAAFAGIDARVSINETGLCASSVAFDRDGRRMLIGGHNSQGIKRGAILWNLEMGTRQTSVWAHPGPVAFDASGRALQLMLNDDRRSGQVWNIVRQQSILKFEFDTELTPAPSENAPEPVLAMRYDGALVAASASFIDGATNRTFLGVWEITSGKRLCQIERPVSALTFAPDGDLIAAGDEDGLITIWQTTTGGLVMRLPASENKIESLAFHRDLFSGPDGQANENWLLAVGEKGGIVTLWDVTKRIPRNFLPGHLWGVYSLAFNPSGTLLAASGRNNVHLWNVANGRLLLKIACSDIINGLSFSPDGRKLAVSGHYGFSPNNFFVWDLDPGRGIYSLRGLRSPIATDKMRFSPDGTMLAALANNWQLGVWDLSTHEPRLLVNVPKGVSADNAALAFSRDSRQFAFATASGARLWELKTGSLAHAPWELPPGLQENLAFHDSGKLLLFRVETIDPTRWPFIHVDDKLHPRVCRIRDLLREDWTNLLAEIPDFNIRVFHSAITPDGKIVVVSGTNDWRGFGTNEYIGYNAVSGARVWSLNSPGSGVFRFDPQGHLTVLAPNNSNSLVAVDSGKIQKTSERGFGQLGPEGKIWLVRGTNGQNGRSVMLQGRDNPLVDLGIDLSGDGEFVFSPDGSMVAWGGDDGTVFVCRLEEVRLRLAQIELGW